MRAGTMKSMAVATKWSIYLALFILAAAIVPGVQSVSWSVGQDQMGWPFINRYDDWGVGYPRRVAYTMDFQIDESTSKLGDICGGYWKESRNGGNVPQGDFDFNCVPTADEISANEETSGFYVGGLNCNGVTIAWCYVYVSRYNQWCDLDVNDAQDCTPYMKCD